MRRSILSDDEAERQAAANSRVWLDGEEVTQDCQIADEEAGEVLLLKRNVHGHHYVNEWGEIAKEWRHGKVEIRDK